MSMDLIYARPIEPPPVDEVSPPQPFLGGDVPLIVLNDSATVWGYTPDGERDWIIKARSAIRGIAVNKTSLYVLDGHVLCQYAAETLQPGLIERPSNAVSFGETALSSWMSERQDPNVFEGLFTATAASPPQTLSPPLCNEADNTVHVLRGDGTVYALLENLDARAGNPIKKTGLVPDALELYLDPVAGVCWISGGQVAVALTGELENPSGGVDAWRTRCGLWPRLVDVGADIKLVPQIAYAGILGPALFRRLQDGSWSFSMLLPACFPSFGEDIVVFEGLDRSPPATNEVYLVTLPPPQIPLELTGILRAEHPILDILGAPVFAEDGTIHIVLKTAASPAVVLAKYRAPAAAAAADWTGSWLKEADATIQSLAGTVANWRIPDPFGWGYIPGLAARKQLPGLWMQYRLHQLSPPGAAPQSPSELWQFVKANRWMLGLVAHAGPGAHPPTLTVLPQGGIPIKVIASFVPID